MAENFLQHAEHYLRILTAAQAAQQTHRRDDPRDDDSRDDDRVEAADDQRGSDHRGHDGRPQDGRNGDGRREAPSREYEEAAESDADIAAEGGQRPAVAESLAVIDGEQPDIVDPSDADAPPKRKPRRPSRRAAVDGEAAADKPSTSRGRGRRSAASADDGESEPVAEPAELPGLSG